METSSSSSSLLGTVYSLASPLYNSHATKRKRKCVNSKNNSEKNDGENAVETVVTHGGGGGGGAAAAHLTLHQLVPIHYSLLSAASAPGTQTTSHIEESSNGNQATTGFLSMLNKTTTDAATATAAHNSLSLPLVEQQILNQLLAPTGTTTNPQNQTRSNHNEEGVLLAIQFLVWWQQQQQQQQPRCFLSLSLCDIILPYFVWRSSSDNGRSNSCHEEVDDHKDDYHVHFDDDEVDEDNGEDDEDLVESILTVAFDERHCTSATTTTNKMTVQDWRNILQACQQAAAGLLLSSSSSSTVVADEDGMVVDHTRLFSYVCRVYKRLDQYLQQHQVEANKNINDIQTMKQLLLDNVVGLVVQAMEWSTSTTTPAQTRASSNQTRSNSSSKNLLYLRPLNRELLPLLAAATTNAAEAEEGKESIAASSSTQIAPSERVWLHLWKLLQQQQQSSSSSSTTTSLLMATTVLCVLLPSWVDRRCLSLFVKEEDDEENEQQQPASAAPAIYHAKLWDLLHNCLRQGLYLSKRRFSWVDDIWKTNNAQPQTTATNDTTSTEEEPQESKQQQEEVNLDATDSAADIALENNTDSRNKSARGGGSVEEDHAQLLRRRGLYLMSLLVNDNHDIKENNKSNSKDSTDTGSYRDNEDEAITTKTRLLFWNKYVACFEALEMEDTPHLVDQVWESVAEIGRQIPASETAAAAGTSSPLAPPPPCTWAWMQLLLSRVIVSNETPALRKLSLYRLFKSQAGIVVDSNRQEAQKANDPKAGAPFLGNKKKRTKNPLSQVHSQQPHGAPLSVVSPNFIQTILVSFNTLEASVGWMMHADQDGQEIAEDLRVLLSNFLEAYVATLLTSASSPSDAALVGREEEKEADTKRYDEQEERRKQRCRGFFRVLWKATTVCELHRKVLVLVFQSVASAIQKYNSSSSSSSLCLRIPVTNELLVMATESLHNLFTFGSVILKQRESLLQSLAIMLSQTESSETLAPKTILGVLGLFSIPDDDNATAARINTSETTGGSPDKKFLSRLDTDPTFRSLKQMISNMASSSSMLATASKPDSNNWAFVTGSALSTAFVDGMLVSTSGSNNSNDNNSTWDPMSISSASEQELGKAVVLFCALATATAPCVNGHDEASQTNESQSTAGQLLWPAIHKGMSNVPTSLLGTGWIKAEKVARALLLLENGCKMRVISGMGNGDLLVDRKTNQMMPPPMNIEKILEHASSFLVRRIETLFPRVPPMTTVGDFATTTMSKTTGGGCRSSDAKDLSATFAMLLSELRTLHEGYPSSIAICNSWEALLKENVEALLGECLNQNRVERVRNVVIIFAALSSGSSIDSSELLKFSQKLLHLKYEEVKSSTGSAQAARSVFHYAKWGILCIILPVVLDLSSLNDSNKINFIDEFLESATESVSAAPAEALVPIFDSISAAVNCRLALSENDESLSKSTLRSFEKAISTMIHLIGDCKKSDESAYLLDELCALIFQTKLLREEADRLEDNPDCVTPILSSFRFFIKQAGRHKPHISSAVLCRIVPGWLGESREGVEMGFSAIPYRDDIVELLLHKEERVAEGSLNQHFLKGWNRDESVIQIPPATNVCSLARAFLLVFLSKLPDVENGLSPRVRTELLNHLILSLLHEVRPLNKGLVMLGSEAFCRKIRGWQALCLLSRFVTAEIAETVCDKTFEASAECLHGQIRYFIEIFMLQCARRHSEIFGLKLVQEIALTNLSLQQISTLMIVSGNLIVGRYRNDFSAFFTASRLNHVVAALIPWLGSTQGFSRAIAQLLVHRLIPKVIDVYRAPTGPGTEDGDWYLRSIFRFLEENSEMKRLRKKQEKFFERYEIDQVCTPVGILNIPVDEGGEAFPPNLVDVMKEALREVYQESHSGEAPTWKQAADLMEAQNDEKSQLQNDFNKSAGQINFQRKIIPIDALNLALEGFKERQLRNRAGRKKQPLIVCASLIDKVPNLGGLARTSEIFAAERLVIPDLRATKMDNFKNLSVSATDWIDIEECKEEDLLDWLRLRKNEGYVIVGLEQTSSSICLSKFKFPDRPIVLLLGKEKEGIPVEFLQAVDQCVEIPQLGIIRSLNVHVSGAITVWEQTRQRMENGRLEM